MKTPTKKELKEAEEYNDYVNNAKMIYYEQSPVRIPDKDLEFILRIAWNVLSTGRVVRKKKLC